MTMSMSKIIVLSSQEVENLPACLIDLAILFQLIKFEIKFRDQNCHDSLGHYDHNANYYDHADHANRDDRADEDDAKIKWQQLKMSSERRERRPRRGLGKPTVTKLFFGDSLNCPCFSGCFANSWHKVLDWK